MLGILRFGPVIRVRFPYPVSVRLPSELAFPAVGLSVSHDSLCIPQFSFQRLVLRLDCRAVSAYVEASIRAQEANRHLACTASFLMTYNIFGNFIGTSFGASNLVCVIALLLDSLR